jgi:acyl-CoA synthetase (AMP-forming)/AMP-acid ligase II
LLLKDHIDNILCLILEASKEFGNKEFIISPNNKSHYLTYQDLEMSLSGLERLLNKNYVAEQEAIGVILPNCNSMAALFLLIPALNRIFVPINIKGSKSEIKYLIKNSNIKLIFKKTGLNDLSFPKIPTIEVDIEDEIWIKNKFLSKGQLNLNQKFNKDNIAEIVYTSGSTGKPKGVQLSHENLISNSLSIAKSFSFEQKDKFLTLTPLFHNSGQIFTTLAPIWGGSSTIPVRPEIGLIAFWDLIHGNSITWTLGMGSHIYFLLSNDIEVKNNHSLKGILVGGMKLNNRKREQFEEKYNTAIYITYGLTETTSFATCETPDINKINGSVGKNLSVNEIKIKKSGIEKDEGEILIRGDNVFVSYQKDKKLTETKKIKGWLHTGDIGYLDKEGNLFITDRKDNLIIVSGENVYPSEIEQYINLLPEIYEAIVIGAKHEIKGMELALIYSLNASSKININVWKKILLSNLPIFKIPTRYVNINELGFKEIPKLPNGKILRHNVEKALIDINND